MLALCLEKGFNGSRELIIKLYQRIMNLDYPLKVDSGEGVSESHFYMWRTVFAIAHVDDIVSKEETRLMAEAFEEVPFSDEQRKVLEKDVTEAQDIEEMFDKITAPEDRTKFFDIAREMVHIDGDYGDEEQAIMMKLTQSNIKKTDIDGLVGKVNLRLEDDDDNFS